MAPQARARYIPRMPPLPIPSFLRSSGCSPATALVLILCAFAAAQPGYVSNLTGSLSTHDPVILKQDSVYYLFHTGNGVQIKTSRDRIDWEPGSPDRVIASNPAWHAKYSTSNSLWAPAIAYWDSTYWLYYSLSNFGERRSAIGLRTNVTLHQDDPDYEWVDRGMVVCTYSNASTHPECFNAATTSVNTNDTTAFNAIDPDIVFDGDGTPWLSWGSFGSGLPLIRLDRATGKPDSGAVPTMIAHRYFTGAPGGSGYYRSIEAPVISRHGGWYYLWYSHDRCCAQENSTYKVKVTRAASVQGPYVDKAGALAHPPYRAPGTTGNWQPANAGTLVSQGDSINWAATGHNDILVDRDTVFLVNHGYLWPGGQTRLMIRPLYWDSEGWPTLDSAQGTIAWQGPPPPVSIRARAVEASQAGPEASVRRLPPGRALVPWNDGYRDLRGRMVPAKPRTGTDRTPDPNPAP